MSNSFLLPRHSLATRLLHGGLALAVILQLATSLVMRHRGSAFEVGLYSLHQVSGLVALALAFLFWINILRRRFGTATGALLPWFSAERRAALWADLVSYARAARRLSLPPHEEAEALPSAIHGLGLLLISTMAATGCYWFVMSLFGLGRAGYVRPVLELHETLGNLVWAYLIGHAALGLLHHLARTLPLTSMWSLRP